MVSSDVTIYLKSLPIGQNCQKAGELGTGATTLSVLAAFAAAADASAADAFAADTSATAAAAFFQDSFRICL